MTNVKLNGFGWESVIVDASAGEIGAVADALMEIGVDAQFDHELGELLIFGETMVLGIVSNDER